MSTLETGLLADPCDVVAAVFVDLKPLETLCGRPERLQHGQRGCAADSDDQSQDENTHRDGPAIHIVFQESP